ncbi:cytochrome C oxidase subunit I [Massilia sp. RP-1-19]|uniref:Cytochrome C oxidase subunit I n=1 Tax=Massilia polaris TaxID=2728846 RepID=A0A848HR00_9BURK|nr:cytochrome C oxidase subunit I [Massilia polaris]
MKKRTGRWKLFAVLLVCASPLLLSYLAYYVIKPSGRTNYGQLLDPREHPIPQLGATALDGQPASLDQFKGKWIMLNVDNGDCQQECRDQLVQMRQLRLMQGKERERVERVWLVTDTTPLDTMLMRVIEGTQMLRVPAEAVAKWLPVEQGGSAADHIYLIDPLGNLMMRFPKDADPAKVKKDLGKLLKASAIG